jgi:hypothetical protein
LLYAWFVFASLWLVMWFLVYIARPVLRRQMLWVSLFTCLAGFTGPLFVPIYWHPQSSFYIASIRGLTSKVSCLLLQSAGWAPFCMRLL